MKTILPVRIIAALVIMSTLFYSCQKTEIGKQDDTSADNSLVYKSAITLENGRISVGGVTLTAPETVNVSENFNILAEINCGRVAIERGYIAGPGGVKIYKNLDCLSAGLIWEEILNFQCYTTDASWNGALSETGTYVYRTKHNAADGNCDGLGGSDRTGNCSFTGNEAYCFTIEAVEACNTSFTGQAISCGEQRQAIFKFTSAEDMSYIKIQGGLTNFTGENASITVSGGNLTASQLTPGGSSNRVIKVEGSVPACEEITITVSWNSTNAGVIITGDWSVKNAAGNELAPTVAGLACGSGRF